METARIVVLCCELVTVAIAVYTDVRYQKIYNWLTLPAAAVGMLVQLAGWGWGGVFASGLSSSITGAAFCAVVFGVFAYWRRGFGMGDVKLLAALGAQAGFLPVLKLVMYAAIIGAMLSLLWVGVGIFTGGGNPDSRGSGLPRLPYAIAIALGTVLQIVSELGWVGLL
ncbi:MAG: prepilin peptidase [Deltaproteobacteria bacterium]|nr:MAG: prepilin peptidase [Deltaproteobacteria bacterium]